LGSNVLSNPPPKDPSNGNKIVIHNVINGRNRITHRTAAAPRICPFQIMLLIHNTRNQGVWNWLSFRNIDADLKFTLILSLPSQLIISDRPAVLAEPVPLRHGGPQPDTVSVRS
jgi:hypothetical protein